MRIIRGQPQLSSKKAAAAESSGTKVINYAWLTKEEIKEKLGGVKNEYWRQVEGMLSR